ncbi:MAG TPA: glycine cleavage T C-terminal barrel domain-containing protein [Thermoanaerobaculia bacterium]|nr:glycine cleavage T C-terminal barrel domain-containing protein [Thermoanaerobaculia bacterium]
MSDAAVPDGYSALREGCAVVERSWVACWEVSGADRQRFLNAYLTCDVKVLAPGAGAYGFFTDKQGRIEADAVVLALADRLRVELPADRAGAQAERLRKFVIADRVEIVAGAELVPLTLAGPAAEELLAAAGAPALPEAAWSHAPAAPFGVEVILVRQGRMGAPAFTLWGPAAAAPELAAAFAARGAVPASFEALEVVRVEAGIPRFGADFGPENFPQETGIEEAVSYTKGCYLGQEVVARIHYRGGVQRRLVGLAFDGDAAPAHGAALRHDGREAGAVGSALRSPALGRPIGLAIVHQRAAEPGTVLEVEGGGSAEVAALPFL